MLDKSKKLKPTTENEDEEGDYQKAIATTFRDSEESAQNPEEEQQQTTNSAPLKHINFLEELEVPLYKIASFENTDLPLIRKVAATGKPMIISTGMATVAELDETVQAAREAGCKDIVLLKCTSTYPATFAPTHIQGPIFPSYMHQSQLPLLCSSLSVLSHPVILRAFLIPRIIRSHLHIAFARIYSSRYRRRGTRRKCPRDFQVELPLVSPPAILRLRQVITV